MLVYQRVVHNSQKLIGTVVAPLAPTSYKVMR